VRLAGLISLIVFAAASSHAPAEGAQPTGSVRVEAQRFELVTSDGRRLTSADLAGAVFEMKDASGTPFTLRIDSVAPAKERPHILLHTFSALDRSTNAWEPFCQPDASGRQVGFPVKGRWTLNGRYVKDPDAWFVTCTSGSQGKCILWGYDPWSTGPKGEDLAPYYQACQYLARADYDGLGDAHTRDGTTVDIWDIAGVQKPDTLGDAAFSFEAGWGVDGAVCVAHTRWPDLLPLNTLLESTPALAASPCDPEEARKRGALLFNRSR
jgi:hypothetical protein